MAADARRCPASAQCRILGVPRSTYYRMLAHPPRPKAPDPIEPDVLGAFEGPRGGYGARRLKVDTATIKTADCTTPLCRSRYRGFANRATGNKLAPNRYCVWRERDWKGTSWGS